MKKTHWILLGIALLAIVIYFINKKRSSESSYAGSTSRVAKKTSANVVLNRLTYRCVHTELTCDEACKKKYGNTPGCPHECQRTNTYTYIGQGACKAGDKGTIIGATS